jgi:lipopolysaccharide/colanic/teichoic acid biosynthesis glycosyltransferase
MYRYFGKRCFDLCGALVLLFVLSPLMGLVALLVRLFLGAPILFRQERPGLYGRPFVMYKFRTMTDARDAQGSLLPDAERLPLFGRFLRSTSLDELPELFNVLRGEMSLVGPRPLLMEYLSRYTPEQAHRHDVRPGITGWAQTNGRNAIGWDEKFSYDLWYVNHCSFPLDLKILGLTFWRVFQRAGINEQGQVTVQPELVSNQSKA